MMHPFCGEKLKEKLCTEQLSKFRLQFTEFNALFDDLHELSGTHYQKLFSIVTL